MDQGMDIRVVELLCSRLCHDLVSPVGAINNGVELIDDMRENGEAGSTGMLGDAIGLIAHSAGQAAGRLKLFRFAYGTAGGLATRGFAEARAAAEGWLAGGKVTLDWPEDRLDAVLAERPGAVKVLLNLVVLADEVLVRGGTVAVGGTGDARAGSLLVAAAGPVVRLSPEVRAAMAGAVEPDDLAPRTIHAYATGRFAGHYALRLSAEESEGRLALRLDW